MQKSMGKFLAILSVLTVLFLAGCGSKPAPTEEPSKEDEEPAEKKNELVLALGSESDDGFDPTTGWGRYGSPLFQSTLLKRNDELEVINDLATGYEIDEEDRRLWTIHLREDVKFSDGEPLTATDVVFTYKKALENGSVVDLTIVEEVEAEDDYTVKFTLKEPQSTFVNALVATGIVPEHAYDDKYGENPIGSGPFELIQWDKGQQLIVQANPEYYGEKSEFEKMTFLFLNDDAAFAAAKAGEVDIAAIPAAFSNQDVEGMKIEVAHTVDNRGIVYPFVESGETTEDGTPIGNDVTADPAIRQAIDIAVDREALVDGVLEGYGTPAYTSVDGLPWWNSETVVEDSDIEGAKKILEEAGWEMNDGVLEKDGLKAELTLYYLAGDEIRQSLAIAAADMLKPLGIDMKLEGGSWDVIGKNMHANPVLMGWGSHDPHELYNIYGGDFAGIDFFNTGFYKNEQVDEYFKQALRATTEEEANEYWQKAQWDGTTGLSGKGDAAWTWLVNVDHLYLMKENLDIGKQRIHVHGHGWPATDNIEDWKWTE